MQWFHGNVIICFEKFCDFITYLDKLCPHCELRNGSYKKPKGFFNLKCGQFVKVNGILWISF